MVSTKLKKIHEIFATVKKTTWPLQYKWDQCLEPKCVPPAVHHVNVRLGCTDPEQPVDGQCKVGRRVRKLALTWRLWISRQPGHQAGSLGLEAWIFCHTSGIRGDRSGWSCPGSWVFIDSHPWGGQKIKSKFAEVPRLLCSRALGTVRKESPKCLCSIQGCSGNV